MGFSAENFRWLCARSKGDGAGEALSWSINSCKGVVVKSCMSGCACVVKGEGREDGKKSARAREGGRG